ncbi:MAG TPA: ABC transporter ATP-binding protein [Verrucomicrobiae bacterium]
MGEAIIEIRKVTKIFRGRVVAVKDLDLVVERGAVYGLIGRSGSGKTTMLRLLMGLLKPDDGAARILGWDFWKAPRSVRERVAYISQMQRLPGGMTLEDLGRYLKHFNQKWDHEHARRLAGLWNLPWKRAVGNLSNGEQCRAALLLAFASRPEVLVLDEPAAGLDVIFRRELVTQILDAVAENAGCTVLLSTHTIGDLERIADHVGVIRRGSLALSTPLDDLLNKTRRVQLIFESDSPSQVSIPGALRTHRDGAVWNAIVQWTGEGELEALRVSTGARVQVFPMSLEEIFVELFGNENPNGDGNVMG